ncbi:MAG: gamma-glutamyltransferase [Verrucomicrobia bacterium]|nr:gamma-glutamyltransferase [Verrucomicrobiota bacterium]
MRGSLLLFGLAIVSGMAGNSVMAADRLTGESFATRSEVLATNGMVATSQPLAVQAGVRILREGGNAVDAAIAVNACLGLMEPTGCGIGGDLFAIYYEAETGQLHGLNASGRSARGASLAELKARLAEQDLERIPHLGPLSVSVPGCVDGWFMLHARFGQLPMEQVLAPAIEYAEGGFPVSELIAFYWRLSVPRRAEFPGFSETFTVDGERAPAEGEIWRNPDLAATYKTLAEKGRDAFYEGDLARRMASFLEENGSFLRYEDFRDHRSEWVEPVSIDYRGTELWELPPNGQGIAAQQILNILEGYDIAAMGRTSADYVHHFVEAKKRAFADRARLYGDPAFAEVPVDRLLSEDYAARLRATIDPRRAAREVTPDPERLRKGDTVYLAAADAEGNMISLIQSNFWGMGSGLCPPGMGFGFQNRGTSFSMDPDHPNGYAPGKRPFHTIIPAFLTRGGEPLCAFGVMGGATQPQAHAQIVVNLVDFGLNLQEAGDAPRIVHSGDSEPTGERMSDGGSVALESGFPLATLRELKLRGHRIEWDLGGFGGYQAVWRDPETGVYRGASESRKDGQAAGY